MGPRLLLEKQLARALKKLGFSADTVFEQTLNSSHGDYATNVAMRLAPLLKRAPISIAGDIAKALEAELAGIAEKIETAPPGFVNVFLAPQWLQKQVPEILSAGSGFGRSKAVGRKSKVQVEFISANPTGPLTLANGRGGFLGDCLARVLEAVGYDVTREYYVNDAGEQVRKLGWSILAAVGHESPYPPEQLYRGAYIQDVAKKLGITKKQASPEEKLAQQLANRAVALLLADIKAVVKKAGIKFDVWFSEKGMQRGDAVGKTLAMLKRKKLVEEKDGALWLKTRELGESKDKVLVKSSGDPTYLLPDLAYHLDKLKVRKFDAVIDVVGADHHGHMQALKAGLKALGTKQPEVILVQLVRLIEHGQEVKMSKRAGTFVTLEELLDAVGNDVARFFFLHSSPTSHMDFDLDLAREQSDKNPVYYVQYAHARISSILRKAQDAQLVGSRSQVGKKGVSRSHLLSTNYYLLTHESEISLLKTLVRLPDLVGRIAKNYEMHHLTTYAKELATAFHAFYRDCRVISDDKELTTARLALCRAAQIALANTLGLMGISAPEKM